MHRLPHVMPSRALLATLVMSLVWVSHAHAANNRSKGPDGFSAYASATQTMRYDSNPLRSGSDAKALFGSTTSPTLVLRHTTPRSTIESDTRMDANLFNHSEFNSNDIHQKLLLSRANERWVASIRGSADYDTTRTSELTNYALNLPKVRRTRLEAAPQITFKMNARDQWILNATAADVAYDNRAYTNYALYSLTPTFARRFDARHSGTVSLGGHHYASTRGSKQTSTSIGPSIGWSATLTPHLTTQLTAGAQKTHKSGSNAGADTSSWNDVYSGKIRYKGERDAIDFMAIRARQPFGNGTETLLTTVSMDTRHVIHSALAIKTSAAYQKADYDTAPGVNLDRGWNMGGGVSYALRDTLDLDADYTFKREHLTTIRNPIDQQVVMVSLNYQPSWSRN